MNTRLHQYLLIYFLLATLSCDEEIKFDPTGGRYLPLQVGNYWKLIPENPLGYNIDITVTDEVVIHGKNYFKLHQVAVSSNPEPNIDQYFYMRIDENNFVYLLIDSAVNIDENILRLGAPNGYQWKKSDQMNVSVRIEADEINGHKFNDCKTFFYDYPSSSDEG